MSHSDSMSNKKHDGVPGVSGVRGFEELCMQTICAFRQWVHTDMMGWLHYTTLHYTTLHYTTLHYITLHYTTLLHTIRLDCDTIGPNF